MGLGIAIMLYVDHEEVGDQFYREHLAQFGFPRSRYARSRNFTDYHVTIGYLKEVAENKRKSLIEFLNAELTPKIPLGHLHFEFGVCTLLGPTAIHPYLVSLPINNDLFRTFNLLVADSLTRYSNAKYQLDKLTNPRRYLPHMNLNGQLQRSISADHLHATIHEVNQHLRGRKLPINQLKIY